MSRVNAGQMIDASSKTLHRLLSKVVAGLCLISCGSPESPLAEGGGGAGASGSTSSGVAGQTGGVNAGGPATEGQAGSTVVGGSGGALGGAGAPSAGALDVGGAGGLPPTSDHAGSAGMAGTSATDPGTAGDGKVMVGPSYTKQAELMPQGKPTGKSFNFTLSSTDSQIYTGQDSTLNAKRTFTRRVDVYVPAKYRDGDSAPFMIINDGPGALGNVKLALDNLTPSSDPMRRLPAFVAIAVANGGGDSLGSERGLEYDTMSDRFARFIDTEVLPAVLKNASIRSAYPNFALTADPEGRGALGCSSGGAAALTMGWFRPDLFRRLVTYSGTFVDQQDTDAPEEKTYPLGAWEYHSGMALIANAPAKPLRIVLNANENDNGATAPESGHHNWVMANQRTASALEAKGYHYRYIIGANAGHCDGKVQDGTLADSLVWVWRGYP